MASVSSLEHLLAQETAHHEASAQNPRLQLHDAKLLLPGQHLIVEGRTRVASPVIQVSIQPQPELATKRRGKTWRGSLLGVETSQSHSISSLGHTVTIAQFCLWFHLPLS